MLHQTPEEAIAAYMEFSEEDSNQRFAHTINQLMTLPPMKFDAELTAPRQRAHA